MTLEPLRLDDLSILLGHDNASRIDQCLKVCVVQSMSVETDRVPIFKCQHSISLCFEA